MGYFIHPVPLFAVFILILNDHYLKSHYPSVVTGKLSDLAGLFFFPLFLCALVCLGRNLISPRREGIYWLTKPLLLSMIAVTVAVFALVKMVPVVTDIYLLVLGKVGLPSRVVRDPSDLGALLVLPFTYLFGSKFIE